MYITPNMCPKIKLFILEINFNTHYCWMTLLIKPLEPFEHLQFDSL